MVVAYSDFGWMDQESSQNTIYRTTCLRKKLNVGPTHKTLVLTVRHSILHNRKLMYLSVDGKLTHLSSGRDINPLVLSVHTQLQLSEYIIKSPVPLS